MKTDELVEMLARGETAVDTRAPIIRGALALGAGTLAAMVLMASMFGVQPDLASDMRVPMFWVKVAFVVALLGAGLLASWRLGRPGASLRGVLATIVAPVIGIWVLAAFVLMRADSGQRTELMLGQTWTQCATNIAMLSVPIFAASFWAMKALAPTRLRLAGAAAGLLAGAAAAVVYTLHCPELAAPFLGIWYVLGMLIPTAIGALIGPRVLRW
jgi:hypothetical protein